MKTKHLVAVLLGLVSLALFAADASAMYNPSTGTWMQRDPGPGGMVAAPRLGTAGPAPSDEFVARDPMPAQPQPGLQYADGMNLYQYAGGAPHQHVDPSGLAWTDCFGSVREKQGKICGYSILLLTGSCCSDPEVVIAGVEGYKGQLDCWWRCEKRIHTKAVLAVEGGVAAVGTGAVRLLKPEGARQVGEYTTVARTIGRLIGGESSKAAGVGRLVGRSSIAVAAKATVVVFLFAEACVSWYCSADCK